MTKEKFNQEAQNLIEQGKQVVTEGKQRQIILRKQDGTQIVETNLTVVAGVGLFLLLTGFLTLPLVLIAALVAYATKVKVELGSKATRLEQ
jgi:uncharacterized protein DUF4342